ncbi:hypothetical protein RIF29_28007 [Crotalaria pallida]|uniref:Epidermal patterning factor-like protein n=1 Tax=Crotalaria pallida TaxID=3830 RepID=A0AAN9EUZ8_CROPI
MKGRFFCCFLLIALQIVSLISEASRPFPLPPDAMSHPGPGEAPAPHSSAPNTKDSQKGSMVTEEARSEIMKEEYDRGVNRIGSSPPSCDHKCYGCTPCEAIQVPSTNNRHINLGLQYTNYEPESWQCKCGVYFYSP